MCEIVALCVLFTLLYLFPTGGVGNQSLREEVVTSLKSVREVIQRGEANRAASTD